MSKKKHVKQWAEPDYYEEDDEGYFGGDDFFGEGMMDAASSMIETKLKYAIQLTGMVLGHTEGPMSAGQIFEVFDRASRAVSKSMEMDRD